MVFRVALVGILLLPATSLAQDAGGDTLVIGFEVDAVTFDLPKYTGAATQRLSQLVHENLVIAHTDGTYEPVLATSWTNSDDLTEWTFELRPDVRFHDGTPFDAAAVVENFRRLLDPERSTVAAGWGAVIHDVVALDDMTVQFRLSSPRVSFIHEFIAEARAGIMSPTAANELGEAYGRSPVGTGPFRLIEWVPDDRMAFERNPDYWGGQPTLERVVVRPIPDAETRMIELEQGRIHIATSIPAEHIERLDAIPGVSILDELTFTYRAIYFNINRPPFDELAVRKAVSHAVDYDTIVAALGGSRTVRSQGPMYLLSWALDEGVSEPAFDPDLAARTLEEAGWSRDPSGTWTRDGRPLSVSVLTSVGRWPNDLEMIEAICQQLRDFGIQATSRPMEWTAFLQTVRIDHDFEATIWGVGPRPPDPAMSSLTENFSSGGNINPSQYADPEFDSLVQQAASTADVDTRRALYSEAQRFIMDNYWAVGLYNEVETWAIRDEVKDHVIDLAITYIRLNNATIDD